MSGNDVTVTVIAGIAIVVGIFGTVIPFLPGLTLSWLGVLVWAIFGGAGTGRWVVLGIATILAAAGIAMKYLVPGRRLHRAGVPTWSLLAGGLLGIVGFFVVPVVGLFLGFVLGVFLAELARLKTPKLAWPSTWSAMKAVGLSMLIEIGAALFILVVWVVGVFVA
jgi:uncharacterized protein YqgC (DUF456 family)